MELTGRAVAAGSRRAESTFSGPVGSSPRIQQVDASRAPGIVCLAIAANTLEPRDIAARPNSRAVGRAVAARPTRGTAWELAGNTARATTTAMPGVRSAGRVGRGEGRRAARRRSLKLFAARHENLVTNTSQRT